MTTAFAPMRQCDPTEASTFAPAPMHVIAESAGFTELVLNFSHRCSSVTGCLREATVDIPERMHDYEGGPNLRLARSRNRSRWDDLVAIIPVATYRAARPLHERHHNITEFRR